MAYLDNYGDHHLVFRAEGIFQEERGKMKHLNGNTTRHLAIALEAVGCCVIAIALVFEYLWKAHIGFIGITAGALAVAAGGMVYTKLYRARRDRSK